MYGQALTLMLKKSVFCLLFSSLKTMRSVLGAKGDGIERGKSHDTSWLTSTLRLKSDSVFFLYSSSLTMGRVLFAGGEKSERPISNTYGQARGKERQISEPFFSLRA